MLRSGSKQEWRDRGMLGGCAGRKGTKTRGSGVRARCENEVGTVFCILHCLKHMRSLSRPARALMASAIPSSVESASMHSNTIASVASVF